MEIAAQILKLFLFSIRLLAAADDEELSYRLKIADACYQAGTTRTEQYLCMKLARFESNYRKDVGICTVKGTAGEMTSWQIIPRNDAERARLCQTERENAIFAIERIRESRAACSALPTDEQLAMYARGNCSSEEGKRLSKTRWPTEGETR